MAIISGRRTSVARLRARRPVSVAALMRIAARQDALAAELGEFKEALARERTGIRAELTAITARLDAFEARMGAYGARFDDADSRFDAASARAEDRADSLEERFDLLHDALSEAAALTRESRRRLLRVERELGATSIGDAPGAAGDVPDAEG
jgi:chromosome segregation ATPase